MAFEALTLSTLLCQQPCPVQGLEAIRSRYATYELASHSAVLAIQARDEEIA